MKLFILPLVVASTAAILASTSPAHALDFNFTFTGSNGTVGGTIYGLEADGSEISATDVSIDSASNILQTYRGSIFSASNLSQSNTANTFTINGSVITAASFDFTSAQLNLFLGTPNGNSFTNGGVTTSNSGGFGGATYSAAAAAPVPFDIPGGATIPTLGSLLALGAMRKVRKNIASKTRIANPVTATVR